MKKSKKNPAQRELFCPTARQTNWLLIVGFVSVGYAFYLRYLAIEQSSVGLSCDAGLNTWFCFSRKTAIVLFEHSAFGWFALAVSALNLLRPHLILFAIGVAAAAVGVVLYNTGLSSLAVGLLVLSFARPAKAKA